MPDKNEKERRKQITNDLRQKSIEEFEKSLPMTKDLFRKLFDYLDKELGDKGCDDSSALTQTFLTQIKMCASPEFGRIKLEKSLILKLS